MKDNLINDEAGQLSDFRVEGQEFDALCCRQSASHFALRKALQGLLTFNVDLGNKQKETSSSMKDVCGRQAPDLRKKMKCFVVRVV